MRYGSLIFFLLLISITISLFYVQDKANKQQLANDKEVVLNLWNIPKAGSPVISDQAERAVFDSFLDRYPRFGAESVTGIKLIGPAQESNFLLAMAGDTAPDIYVSNFRSITTFMEQNFCFPLEYLPDFVKWKTEIHHWTDPVSGKKYYAIDAINKLKPETAGRILENPVTNYDHFYLPQVRPIMCKTMQAKDPKTGIARTETLTYAFPTSYCVMGMYFNKNLFSQAGMNPEGPPEDWTWEDFYRACQKLTVPEEGKVGFWLPTGGAAGWMFPNFVWQAGGDIVREFYIDPETEELIPRFDPVTNEDNSSIFSNALKKAVADGSAKTKYLATYNEKPGLEALKFYRRLMGQRWTRCKSPGCIGKNTVYDLDDKWLTSGAVHKCPVCGAEKSFEELRSKKQIYVGCVVADPGGQSSVMFNQQKKCGMMLYEASLDTGMISNPDEIGLAGPPRGPELWEDPNGFVIYRHEAGDLKYSYTDPGTGKIKDVDLSGHEDKIYRYIDPGTKKLVEVDLEKTDFKRLKVNFLNADVAHINNAIWYNASGLVPPPPRDNQKAWLGMTEKQKKAIIHLSAAWLYLKYSVSREARALYTKIYVDNGLAIRIKPDDLEEFGYDEYIKKIPASWVKVNKELTKFGRPEPYAPNYKVVAIQDIASPIDKTYSACEKNKDSDITQFNKNVSDSFLQDKLDDSAGIVNNVRFSSISGEKMGLRRKIANILFALIVILLGFFAYTFVGHAKSLISSQGATGSKTFTNKAELMAWAFMFPALLSILIWNYVPLIRGSMMAFTDYYILTESKFIWLDNFIRLFFDHDFLLSCWNTAFYVSISLAMGFVIPIILAVMLSEIPRGKVFLRVVYYLPHITSGLVITLMWMDFYNSSITGMLNRLLLSAGMIQSDEPVKWLQDTETFHGLLPMICVIIPSIWAAAGGGCLIYLAALKGIPDEIYEAADIDGAGFFSKLKNITFPYIKPLVLINFVGAFIGSFHAAGNILLMTGGGPDNRTMTIGLEIFYNSYLYLRFGYATSMAWILGTALVGFTIYQLRILKDVKFAANS